MLLLVITYLLVPTLAASLQLDESLREGLVGS